MTPLPLCRWMKEPTGPGRARCDSTKIISGAAGVPVADCKPGLFCFNHEPVAEPPRSKPRGPCRHLGAATGEQVKCDTCQGDKYKPTFKCAVHGTTAKDTTITGRATCLFCREYEGPLIQLAAPLPADAPLTILTIDPAKLLPGRCFNCSLIIHKGRRLLAYRKEWASARIVIAELGDDWQPIANHRIYWGDRHHGHEDPRLFTYRGDLYLSYTGYNGSTTSVGYVRLRDDLTATAAWMPDLHGRKHWEKNWQFFEHDDGLYAAYYPSPHTILRIQGVHAERAYESVWRPDWQWGEMRGGASPVRVGDEFYHFFHARMPAHNGQYSLGLYTFEARPPFRPLRMIPRPLILARPEERPEPGIATVVFPGSATLLNGQWIVGAGWMDSACRLYFFDAAEVERELRPV